MKQFLSFITLLFAAMFFAGNSFGQDVTVTDPEHNKVEYENDQLRVIRVTHNPGDKGEMHSHPEGLVIFLTDVKVKLTTPDGTTRDAEGKAGQVIWMSAVTHKAEYTGDKPSELIHIEMKNKK